MRTDAIEHRLTKRVKLTRSARHKRKAVTRARDEHEGVATAAIDEVFAAWQRTTGRITRVDGAGRCAPQRSRSTIGAIDAISVPSQLLLKQVATQLVALERQRENLAHLIRGVDGTTCD